MKRVLLIDSEEALYELLKAYLPDVEFDRARNAIDQNSLLTSNKYNMIFVNQSSKVNYGLLSYLKAIHKAPIILSLEVKAGRVGVSLCSSITCEIKDMQQLSWCVEGFLNLGLETFGYTPGKNHEN